MKTCLFRIAPLALILLLTACATPDWEPVTDVEERGGAQSAYARGDYAAAAEAWQREADERAGGKGIDQIFGVIGATMSLVGCLLGNVFTIAYFISVDTGMSVIDVLAQMDVAIVIELMMETFQVMDILFYALAVYFGYRYAFRQLTMDDFNRALGRIM